MEKQTTVHALRKLPACVALAAAVASAVAAEATCGAAEDSEKPLKVLMVGNSFSICNLKQMPSVAAAMGKRVDLASLYIGGCSLERHWSNVAAASTNAAFRPYRFDRIVDGNRTVDGGKANIPDALVLDRWDVVTVQQASHFSWRPETYEPFGGLLVAKIRELAPQAKIVVQETWSYPPWDRRLAKFGFDQAEMYRRLRGAYAAFAGKYGLDVIPVGTAAEIVPDRNSLFTRPDFHFNRDGEYLQGLAFTAKLFGADVGKCPYKPDWMEPSRAEEIKKAVMDACLARDSARPAPSPALAARLAEGPEIYGIVHWGLNTYTDREWGFGDEDPSMLNPDKFDADQIVGACKAGGLGGLVVVAKHHDGFCLWPSKTTEHNISKTPFWRGMGKGLPAEALAKAGERITGRDYVKEMEQACRRHGLKFGVYVSPWDRNSAHYATEKYVDIYHRQIKELLSGDYGEVFEMWFDGANGGDGWYGGAREKRRIGAGYYRFGEVFGFVRGLQPNVCIFAGEEDSSDFRWPGNERGVLDPDSRATVCTVGGYADGKYGNPLYKDQIDSGSPDGEFFRMCEADFPLRRGWFYHEKDRGTTKGAAYLTKLYLSSVGNGGTMNIGIAPDKSGRLDEDDVRALAGFGSMRGALFAREAGDGEKFNVVVLREDVSRGELVDEWEFVAGGEAILRGKSIGNKRIRILKEPVVNEGCGVRVLRGVGGPRASCSLYCADQSVIEAILGAKGDDGETDTAQWMTFVKPEKRNNAK